MEAKNIQLGKFWKGGKVRRRNTNGREMRELDVRARV